MLALPWGIKDLREGKEKRLQLFKTFLWYISSELRMPGDLSYSSHSYTAFFFFFFLKSLSFIFSMKNSPGTVLLVLSTQVAISWVAVFTTYSIKLSFLNNLASFLFVNNYISLSLPSVLLIVFNLFYFHDLIVLVKQQGKKNNWKFTNISLWS